MGLLYKTIIQLSNTESNPNSKSYFETQKSDESTTKKIPLTTLDPPGKICMYGGSSAPTGWLMCDGSAISRTNYAELFTVIGTTFGVGDGSTTFNLPDFRSAFPRGVGTSTKFTQNHTTILGTYEDDAMQGHYHSKSPSPFYGFNDVAGAYGAAAGGVEWVTMEVTSPSTDGINGTPRTDDETRPNNLGINFIIKY